MRPTARDARAALLLLALAIFPAVGSWLVVRDDPEYRLSIMSIDRLRAGDIPSSRMDNLLWLDARPSNAFVAGHLPGAINVGGMAPDDASAAIAAAWRPRLRPVVYGDPRDASGPRRTAARLSRDMGIGEIGVLIGDWRRVHKRSTQEARP